MPLMQPIEVRSAALPAQIVVNCNCMTLLQKTLGAVRADKAGAAGNEDFHRRYYIVFNYDWRLGALKLVFA